MTPPRTVTARSPVRRAAAILTTGAPLVAVVDDDGRYRGALAQADLPPGGSEDEPVGEVMRTDILLAHPDEGVWDLVTILRLAGLAEVPVVEDGVVVGMVSHHDLLRAIARDDEAVAADVRRRLGPQEPGWNVVVDGGRVTLRSAADPSADECRSARLGAESVIGVESVQIRRGPRSGVDRTARSGW